MTTAAVVAGAVVGLGVWLALSWVSPARVPLGVAVVRLGRPARVAPEVGSGSVDARLGRWLRRFAVVDRAVAMVEDDLRMLRRSPDEQAAQLVVAGVLGVLAGPFIVAAGVVAGVGIPMVVPVWFAALGGAAGVGLTVRGARQDAARERQAFVHALGAFCDVAGMSLAAGRQVEGAMQTAAAAGEGWPFLELRGALHRGYLRGETPWQALGGLGAELGVADLEELAAALSLAGDEGASVRATIATKARSMRERLVAESEREAAAVTERMGIPATFFLIGFAVFLGFPALAALFADAK